MNLFDCSAEDDSGVLVQPSESEVKDGAADIVKIDVLGCERVVS